MSPVLVAVLIALLVIFLICAAWDIYDQHKRSKR
jgi:hypothetical protein